MDFRVVCEFCQHTFSSKTNLVYHQKNAKFCLKKRNLYCEPKCQKKVEYSCNFCNRAFVYKKIYENHVAKCYNNVEPTLLRTKIKLMEKELDKKDKAYQKLAHLPRNLVVFSEDVVNNALGSHLTLGHIAQGAKGYCRLGQEQKFFENRLLVTDRSRLAIKVKIPEIVTDYGGVRLSEIFFNGISEPNNKLITDYIESLQNKRNLLEYKIQENSDLECKTKKAENNRYRTNEILMEELELCYGKLSIFTKIKSQVSAICRGEGADTKLQKDFIKCLINSTGNLKICQVDADEDGEVESDEAENDENGNEAEIDKIDEIDEIDN